MALLIYRKASSIVEELFTYPGQSVAGKPHYVWELYK